MARGHGPSAYREVLRRLKEGRDDPGRLIEAALDIGDAGQSARALAAVAADRRLLPAALDQARAQIVARLGAERREVAVAEAVPDILKRLPETEEWAATRRRVLQRLLDLPDGTPLGGGIREAVKVATAPERVLLFERAASNRDLARDDVKAVLRAAFPDGDAARWLERVEALPDLDLRARSAAYLHHEVATNDATDPVGVKAMASACAVLAAIDAADDLREDRWRAIARSAATTAAIDLLVKTLDEQEDPLLRADIHLALGAQADRLGDPDRARRSFDKSAALLPLVPARDADRIRRKLEQASARLEGVPGPTKHRPPRHGAVDVPTVMGPLQRHALALVNTYTGGTKPAHLRALARAAPLCVAFDLDLVLVGFPDEPGALVARAATETRISGRDPLVDLARSGRLRAIASDPHSDPEGWAAADVWIATSERADEHRKRSLEQAASRGAVALLVGLGPKGLPRGIRQRADAEYEITGQGIGLETATAMGILADRLGRLPAPTRKAR